MKRLFLFPTEAEAEEFRKAAPEADVRISGVGAAETAVSVARALRDGYKFLILAGIAGTYDREIETGAVFAVEEERLAGLPEQYGRRYRAEFMPKGLTAAVANTVSQCGAEPRGAQLENMEGAVFFAMCADAGVRFCEIRAVSNTVGDPSENWEFGVALESLTRTLKNTFIDNRIMNKTKIIIYVALALILIAALSLLLTQWKYLLAKIMTWVVVICIAFLAGWLTGRFGGKKKKNSAEA